jgi:hypothetical protein
MFQKLRTMGLAMAAFGLFACNQEEKIASPGKTMEGVGSARLALPDIPAGYLDDSSKSIQAWFALTVSGDGMNPIHQTWVIHPEKPGDLIVPGIPAGARFFHGELVKISGKDTVVTHAGEDSVRIEAGKTAEVYLFLRKAGGGTAHVCVDVEGWPSDGSCLKPPVDAVPDYNGCWNIGTVTFAVPPAMHEAERARLQIIQEDTTLLAVATWSTGEADTGRGIVRYPDGTAIISEGGLYFKGSMDPTRSSIKGSLRSDAKRITGDAEGKRVNCDEPPVPATPKASMACYNVKQAITNGPSSEGRMVLMFQEGKVFGTIKWNDHPYSAILPASFQGAPETKFAVDWSVGQSGSGEFLSYRGTLVGVGTGSGAIFVPGQPGVIGNWTADRSQCGAYESL